MLIFCLKVCDVKQQKHDANEYVLHSMCPIWYFIKLEYKNEFVSDCIYKYILFSLISLCTPVKLVKGSWQMYRVKELCNDF